MNSRLLRPEGADSCLILNRVINPTASPLTPRGGVRESGEAIFAADSDQ